MDLLLTPAVTTAATLLLAVEEVIPPDHPVAILAIPLGLLFMSGSIYVLLWSNFGARKAAGIYGTAFFGFTMILGVFWWFGAPGIPPNLGITNLPGQAANHYDPVWFAFEPGSERAQYFSGVNTLDSFVEVPAFLGKEDLTRQQLQRDPAFGALAGSSRAAVERMLEQFLPVDQFGVARIGVSRRSLFEEQAAAQQPAGSRRGTPFYTARLEGPVRLFEDPSTGLLLATARFQAVANFTTPDGTPLDPVPVGEAADWFAFYDPGANWFPSALWTIVSLVMFLLSLAYLDRLEQQDKRLARIVVEQPEDLAVPIAQ
jgi:hypothetical protein